MFEATCTVFTPNKRKKNLREEESNPRHLDIDAATSAMRPRKPTWIRIELKNVSLNFGNPVDPVASWT